MYKKTPSNLSVDEFIDFNKENSYTVSANFKMDESFDTAEKISNLNNEYTETKKEEYSTNIKEESKDIEIGNYTKKGIYIVLESSNGNFIYVQVKNI